MNQKYFKGRREDVICFESARELHEHGIRDQHFTDPFPFVSCYFEPDTKSLRRYGMRGKNWKTLYYAPTFTEVITFFRKNFNLLASCSYHEGLMCYYYKVRILDLQTNLDLPLTIEGSFGRYRTYEEAQYFLVRELINALDVKPRYFSVREPINVKPQTFSIEELIALAETARSGLRKHKADCEPEFEFAFFANKNNASYRDYYLFNKYRQKIENHITRIGFLIADLTGINEERRMKEAYDSLKAK